MFIIAPKHEEAAVEVIQMRVFYVAFAIAVSTVALAASSRQFALPDHGALTLAIPDGWDSDLRQPPNRLPPTILLKPSEGREGEVLITAIWPVAPAATIPDEATLRSKVAVAAKRLEPRSVEGTLWLQEFMGKDGR